MFASLKMTEKCSFIRCSYSVSRFDLATVQRGWDLCELRSSGQFGWLAAKIVVVYDDYGTVKVCAVWYTSNLHTKLCVIRLWNIRCSWHLGLKTKVNKTKIWECRFSFTLPHLGVNTPMWILFFNIFRATDFICWLNYASITGNVFVYFGHKDDSLHESVSLLIWDQVCS